MAIEVAFKAVGDHGVVGDHEVAVDDLQCVTIENRQSSFYVVNRVNLAEKKLYQKSCLASELTICMLRGFRSFQKGTLSLCKSIDCKVTSCQS